MFTAIRDGQVAFNEAMKVRYGIPDDADTNDLKATAAELLKNKRASVADRRAAAAAVAQPPTVGVKPPSYIEPTDPLPDPTAADCPQWAKKGDGSLYQRVDDGTGFVWSLWQQ